MKKCVLKFINLVKAFVLLLDTITGSKTPKWIQLGHLSLDTFLGCSLSTTLVYIHEMFLIHCMNIPSPPV